MNTLWLLHDRLILLCCCKLQVSDAKIKGFAAASGYEARSVRHAVFIGQEITVIRLSDMRTWFVLTALCSADMDDYEAPICLMMQKPLPFVAPTRVYMVGSHATKTAIQQDSVVDVAVELPASCFERKDHLNHRYLSKRALYLAALATVLANQPPFADQRWQCFNDDPRYTLGALW